MLGRGLRLNRPRSLGVQTRACSAPGWSPGAVPNAGRPRHCLCARRREVSVSGAASVEVVGEILGWNEEALMCRADQGRIPRPPSDRG